MTSEERAYVKEFIKGINNIGYQLKRLADLEQAKWNEEHHNYMEDDEDDS